MAERKPEQIQDKYDHLRIELDSKIDKKLSSSIFFWIMAAIGAILLYLANQINDIKDNKISALQTSLAVSETKVEAIESRFKK